MRTLALVASLALLSAAACLSESTTGGVGGVSDIATDTGPADVGAADPGTLPDPGTPDPGVPDPGTPDPGAPDPGTPDPGAPDMSPPDVGPGDVSATCPLPLLDLGLDLAVTGAADIEPLDLDVAVTVVSHAPWMGGANFEWALELANDDGIEVRVRYRLDGRPAPLLHGEGLRLQVRQGCFIGCTTQLALTDGEGLVRLQWQQGSAAADCLEGAWCLDFASGGVCFDPTPMCGPEENPLVIVGGPQGNDEPIAAYQGEVVAMPDGGELLVGEAARTTEPQCEGAPFERVLAAVVGSTPALDCDLDKLGLTQENPELYELYEVCFPGGAGVDPTSELVAIDPAVNCPSGGNFAKCAPGEEACFGTLSFASYDSKEISLAHWAVLCEISQLPWVTSIGGGHWL